MMCRSIFLFLLLGLASSSHAQLATDGRIILTGTTDAQRQVLGLPPSILSGDVLTAAVDQSGASLYAAAIANTPQNWQASIDGLQQGLLPGTHVLIEVPLNASGDISLNINGSGDKPVKLRGGTALDGELYEAGSLLSLVYDGSAFQLMNGPAHSRRQCPSGMVQANEGLCIDLNEEATALPFFDAVMVCIQQDKRMCSWGEWHSSCRKSNELGLLNMEDNAEWTANTANYSGGVRTVGNGSCYNGATDNVYNATPRKFRCCLPR